MKSRAACRAVALLTFVVALSGCSTAAPLPSGAIAVPTDQNVVSSAESGILCTLGAVIPPVVGVLMGDPSDPAWPVWLQAADGHPMYIRWPRGFSVRFDPEATLLDETGAVFLLSGSPITLAQMGPDPAGGTKDQPYVVAGLVETGLGHEEHCYTPKS
jgi:hypothetical protein